MANLIRKCDLLHEAECPEWVRAVVMLSVNNSRKLNTLCTNHVPIVPSSHNKSRVLCWNWYVPTMHHSNSTVRPACLPRPDDFIYVEFNTRYKCGCHHCVCLPEQPPPPWLRWYAPQFHNKSKPMMELGWGFGDGKVWKTTLNSKVNQQRIRFKSPSRAIRNQLLLQSLGLCRYNHLCWNSPDFEDSFKKLKP